MTATTTSILPRNASLGFLALLGGGFAVGFSPIFARLSDLAPIASGFYRLGLAVPAIWILCALAGERVAAPATIARGDLVRLVLGGMAFAADIAFWHLAIAYTRVSEATLMASMAPIIVASAAVMFFGERLKPLFLAGLLISLIGVATLTLQPIHGGTPPINRLLGGVLAFGAAGFYAIYVLLLIGARQRSSTATIMVYTSAVAALSILPFALMTAPTMLPGSLYSWSILAGLAVISHAGGQGLLIFALPHLPISLSSMVGLIQTAIASIAAWIIFDEPLTAMMLASAAAILAGIFICRRASVV